MSGINSKNSYELYSKVVDKSDLKAFHKEFSQKEPDSGDIADFITARLAAKKSDPHHKSTVQGMYTDFDDITNADALHFLKALKAELVIQQGLDEVDTKKEKSYGKLFSKIDSQISVHEMYINGAANMAAQIERPEIAKQLQKDAKYSHLKLDEATIDYDKASGAEIATFSAKSRVLPFDKAYATEADQAKFITDNKAQLDNLIKNTQELSKKLDGSVTIEVKNIPAVPGVDAKTANLDGFAAKNTETDVAKDNRVDITDSKALQDKVRTAIEQSTLPGKEAIAGNKLLNDGGKIGAYTLTALKDSSPQLYNEMMKDHPLKATIDKMHLNQKGELETQDNKFVSKEELSKIYASLKAPAEQGKLVASANIAIEVINDRPQTAVAATTQNIKHVDEKAVAAVYADAAKQFYDKTAKEFDGDVSKKVSGNLNKYASEAMAYQDKEAIDKFKEMVKKGIKEGEYSGVNGIDTQAEKKLAETAKQLGLTISHNTQTSSLEVSDKAGIKLGELSAYAEKKPTSTPAVEKTGEVASASK